MDIGRPLEGPITFQEMLPCDSAQIARNVAHALSLGLPDADEGRLDVLNIVASGPSAAFADFEAIGSGFTGPVLAAQPVLAVNGALKMLLDRGIAPHFWAACDPQPLVADFVPDIPPVSTTYLICAKCDPAVFTKLKNRDVKLWYVGDAPEGHRNVKTACSVTLTVLSLMRHLGWRKFRIWGWDCCFDVAGAHHASDQGAPSEDARINLIVGERSWPTTHPWALEAQDAAHQLAAADYDVEIMGDSMVAAVIAEVRRQMALGSPTLTPEAEARQTAA
jgi:hypothetical protein